MLNAEAIGPKVPATSGHAVEANHQRLWVLLDRAVCRQCVNLTRVQVVMLVLFLILATLVRTRLDILGGLCDGLGGTWVVHLRYLVFRSMNIEGTAPAEYKKSANMRQKANANRVSQGKTMVAMAGSSTNSNACHIRKPPILACFCQGRGWIRVGQ